MFWCNHCNKELRHEEVYFDYKENAFRCNYCGYLIEYKW